MNIYKFPYDKQTCSIQIGSWGLVNEIISFYHKEFVEKNAVDFVPNSIWTITNQQVEIFNTSRISNIWQTSDVHYTFTLKRGSLYFMINNLYPCLILNIISLVTFFMPFVSKASLSILKFKLF